MGVTGEGVLFQSERDGVEEWRFLWKDEVKQTIEGDGRWERVRADKQPYSPREIGIAYRLWTPHPRHSDEADSPLRSVMDIAEELLILTMAVRATAISRMTNGVWAMPSELSFASVSGQYLGDEDPQTNSPTRPARSGSRTGCGHPTRAIPTRPTPRCARSWTSPRSCSS